MRSKNKVVAAILAIFTGVIGGHKLYLRDIGGFMSFIFILIFTTQLFNFPLTLLFGVFEAFKLLSMTDEQFDKLYNKGIRKPKYQNVDRRRAEQLRRYKQEPVRRASSHKARVSSRRNPFKASGLSKYKEFDLEGAIDDFKQGLDINPNDIALHFNLACAYSLTEKKELSFNHLSKAVQLGFKDFDRIMSHDDLAYLRIQPEFNQFKVSGFTNAPVAKGTKTIEKKAEKQDDVLLSQLNRLAELRNKGILSEAEFNLEKKKLMSR